MIKQFSDVEITLASWD